MIVYRVCGGGVVHELRLFRQRGQFIIITVYLTLLDKID